MPHVELMFLAVGIGCFIAPRAVLPLVPALLVVIEPATPVLRVNASDTSSILGGLLAGDSQGRPLNVEVLDLDVVGVFYQNAREAIDVDQWL